VKPGEIAILKSFIKRCASDLGNNSCNDFNVEDFIPNVEERRALAKEMHEENGDPEEFDPKGTYRHMPDFWLLSYLGDKAVAELETKRVG
jgi:hypothetical protein